MKSRLIRIGSSRGLRLPKPMLKQAGLEGEVELRVRGRSLIISSAKRPREGWEAAALALRERGGHQLLDEAAPTEFDKAEWSWC